MPPMLSSHCRAPAPVIGSQN